MTSSSPLDAPAPPDGPSSPLKIPDFRRFCLARLLLFTAITAQSSALGWQVYALARQTLSIEQSSLYLGMVGLAQFLPLFLLVLPAGESADRYDRKRIVQFCLMGEAACAVLFMLLSHFKGPQTLNLMLLVAALFGVSRGFIAPASQALGPMLVPRELFPKAISFNAFAFQFGAVVGPALGAILAGIDPMLAYGVAFVAYLFAFYLMSRIEANTKPEAPQGSRLEQVKEGLKYVWNTKIIFGAISLDLFAVLLGGATALLPVYAKDVLHIGPEGFGILRILPTLGAAGMTMMLVRRPLMKNAGKWMFGAVIVFGAATIIFGLSTNVVVSGIMLAILGAADQISVYTRSTLVQLTVPDAMRGRVSAVSSLFISASNELGEFESGVAARFLGAVGAVIAGGVGSILITLSWIKLFPDLWKADKLH